MITNSFYKLFGSLCEPRSPYHPLETTIKLNENFEIKAELHILKQIWKLEIN